MLTHRKKRAKDNAAEIGITEARYLGRHGE